MKHIYVLIIILIIISPIYSFAQDWTLTQILHPNPNVNSGADDYGGSVAMDGDYAVVTINRKADGVYFEGEAAVAYVLFHDGVYWDTIATLSCLQGYSGPNYFSYEGTTVSISGTTIVVGMEGGLDNYNHYHNGSALVYEMPENGWEDMTQTASLYNPMHQLAYYFGCSVSIHNNTIVVGADEGRGYYAGNGAVYIFEKPVEGWNGTVHSAATLNVSGSDKFGSSVCVYDSTIVVASGGTGKAYVYEKPIEGWYNMTATAVLSGGLINDFSVDIERNIIVAGYKVFTKPINGWESTSESVTLRTGFPNGTSNYGCSNDISNGRIIIGANGYTDTGNKKRGRSFVFQMPAGGWCDMEPSYNFYDSGATLYSFFGNDVAISNNKIIVGAPKDNNSQGAVYCYNTPNTFNSIDINLCETNSYTTPSGDETYTQSGEYVDTIPNSIGADSIIYISLIANSNTIDLYDTTCYVYNWYGIDYNESGVYQQTFTNIYGCDSVIVLHLTIEENTTSELYRTSCVSYKWNGVEYTESGDYDKVYTYDDRCDYVITLHLTIETVNSNIHKNNYILFADETAATYQWLTCDSLYQEIDKETSQSFTPKVDGLYAVVINDGNCIDTSSCFDFHGKIFLYPNPTTGRFSINASGIEKIKAYNSIGQLLFECKENDIDMKSYAKGVYYINIKTIDNITTKKLILE